MGLHDEEYLDWAAQAQDGLLRSAHLICGSAQAAEDLVQEALVKVALRWTRLRDGHPTAYARSIIARDHVSWWRRRRREMLTADGGPDGPSAPVTPEVRLVVLQALARLTPAQRAVLVLRHLDDLSEKQTAAALGVSVGTVKSQNAVALARLRTGAPELLDLIGDPS